eukprot:Platyproteum_vivax@DN5222_c0_g1_i1.p1
MRWGNAFLHLEKNAEGNVTKIKAKLNPGGSAKSTKKKLHWIPVSDKSVPIIVKEFDHLIKKEKPEDEDNMQDIVNLNSCHETKGLGEVHMTNLKKGDVIQLERRGYGIVDAVQGNTLIIHIVPDGRTKNMSILSSKVDKSTLVKGGKIAN